MTTMPGNPHAELVEKFPTSVNAEAAATLALAFEQRTANLIAAAQLVNQLANARLYDADNAARLWVDHITPRLGLGDDQ